MSVRRRLGDALLTAGLITRQQLDEALAAEVKTGASLADILVASGVVEPAKLLQALCAQAGIPFLDEADLAPQDDALALIRADAARMHSAVPLRIESRHVVVAMADPFDMLAIRALTRVAGRSLRVMGAAPESVRRAIEQCYASGASLAVAVGGDIPAPAPKLEVVRASSPAIRLAPEPPPEAAAGAPILDDLVRNGLAVAATDIHLERREAGVQVRYRIDGLLSDGPLMPVESLTALIARLAALTTLDASITRLPQNSHARLRIDDRSVDLRISVFPTLHGDDVVLRVLDRSRTVLPLDQLGIEPDDLVLFRNTLKRSHGLIPVSGPGGSGRTSTLYAAMLELSAGDRAAITLEDPVEHEIAGIRQAQLRDGFSFAAALESALHHDPDVILVGETRDAATAALAAIAALTGHLVLTTLHAATSSGAIARLRELGVEPSAITSSVTMFVAQRLVRALCPSCRVNVDMPPAVRRRFGLDNSVLYGPKGCDNCRGTGFLGRVGIFEFLPMSPEVATAIYKGVTPEQILLDSGRPSLLQDGIRKIQSGRTTLDEILRVTA